VTSCHCSRGGKLEVQQGAGGLVDDRQPAGQPPVAHPGLLDGVDLPDLVGACGPRGGGRLRLLGPLRGLESGGPEGQLERPRRGEVIQGDPELAGQFDADELGPPVGVERLEVTGAGHDPAVSGAPAAAAVAGLQAVLAPESEGPPDLPDGVVGEAEVQGDAAEVMAVEAAADDLLSDRHR
jgi:hypothetical protein